MLKKMWNSKSFETISEVNWEVLKAIGSVTAIIGEAIAETFSNSSSTSSEEKNNSTYEYWKSLSYEDQESYFNNNEYLKGYAKNEYYPNDRELTAKHAQRIADSLNREFTNKYDRY